MDQLPESATRGVGGRHVLPWRAVGSGLVAILALVGAGLVGASLRQPPHIHPPQPLAEAAPTDLATTNPAGPLDGATPDPSATPSASATSTRPAPIGLIRSTPTKITIAKIGVAANILPMGVNPDGSVEVPPLERAELAGWYSPGPSPGEIGNAVIVGHVDSRVIGPAVFFRLGALKPGDIVLVTRQDRSVVRFQVDGVKSYPKTGFPTDLVYGPSDKAGLRLVTCGGDFNENTRSYQDNVIAFATLIP